MEQLNKNKWIICRICLKDSSFEMQNIFTPDPSAKDLAVKIHECGGIPIDSSDKLPDSICSKCLLLLRAAVKFRTLCQTSHQQLLHMLKPSNDAAARSYEGVEENYEKSGKNAMKREVESSEEEFISDGMGCVSESDAGEGMQVEAVTGTEDSDGLAAEYIELADCSQNGDIEYLQDEIELLVTSDQSNTESNMPKQEDDSGQYTIGNESVTLALEETNSRDIPHQEVRSPRVINQRKRKHPDKFKVVSEVTKVKKNTRKARKSKASKYMVLTADYAEDANTTFICFHCGNIYSERSKLTLHLKMHNNEKPHECEICHKRFAQTPQLSRHMNSHTGSRPYKCKFCPSSFADPSTCIKHERIHTNERPYKCPSCSKAFSYSNVLKVHMMTHTGEKPFSCASCGKTFAQLHHKKAHERTHNTQSELKKEVQNECSYE